MGCLWLVIGNYESPPDRSSAAIVLGIAILAGLSIGAVIVLLVLRALDRSLGARRGPLVRDGEIVLFFVGALFILYEIGATGAGTAICDKARDNTVVHRLACGR
jgi:hypothetical protein